MRIGLLEDDVLEKNQFIHLMKQIDSYQEIECFSSVAELLSADAKAPGFNVVFFDIHLKKSNGVECARNLRAQNPKVELVFVTSSLTYAVMAYSLNALHYIVKPVQEQDLRDVFDRLRMKQHKPSVLQIKSGKELCMLYQDEVEYIVADNHNIVLHLHNEKTMKSYMKMTEILDQLSDDFLRIQRSVIVNLNYVSNMQKDKCTMRDGKQFLLSRSQRKELFQYYTEFIFRKLQAQETIKI